MNETPVTVAEWPEPGERVRRLRGAVRLSAIERTIEMVEEPREMEKRARGAMSRAHTRFIVSTDPEEHGRKIHECVAWGFTHLVFHFLR